MVVVGGGFVGIVLFIVVIKCGLFFEFVVLGLVLVECDGGIGGGWLGCYVIILDLIVIMFLIVVCDNVYFELVWIVEYFVGCVVVVYVDSWGVLLVEVGLLLCVIGDWLGDIVCELGGMVLIGYEVMCVCCVGGGLWSVILKWLFDGYVFE